MKSFLFYIGGEAGVESGVFWSGKGADEKRFFIDFPTPGGKRGTRRKTF
jgi:hypothetical protein